MYCIGNVSILNERYYVIIGKSCVDYIISEVIVEVVCGILM